MSEAIILGPSRQPPHPTEADRPTPDTERSNTLWRSACLTRILAAALLGGFLLSPKLWLSSRSYPLSPVSDRLPPIPPPLDAIWFGALLLLLLAIAVLPRNRWLLVALLALAGALSLWDQSRWQPWFYQYLAMFGALAWASWKKDRHQATEAALNTCRLIVAATYTWSGIQKLNVCFVVEVYPWLLEPLLRELPQSIRPLVAGMGPVVPAIEIGIGIGLLLQPVRTLAIGAAVAMHLLLLVLLCPTGHNYNSVVWPWNVAMILMVLVLFWRTAALMPWSILWPRRFLYARVILLFFGILPGLHLFGLWDAYLSAALYSGNTLDGHILLSPAQRDQLPADLLLDLRQRDDQWQLDLGVWSMRELNVPDYPARRIYRHVAEELAARLDPAAVLILVVDEQPDWDSALRRETIYPCGGKGSR